eukprot:RCo021234
MASSVLSVTTGLHSESCPISSVPTSSFAAPHPPSEGLFSAVFEEIDLIQAYVEEHLTLQELRRKLQLAKFLSERSCFLSSFEIGTDVKALRELTATLPALQALCEKAQEQLRERRCCGAVAVDLQNHKVFAELLHHALHSLEGWRDPEEILPSIKTWLSSQELALEGASKNLQQDMNALQHTAGELRALRQLCSYLTPSSSAHTAGLPLRFPPPPESQHITR